MGNFEKFSDERVAIIKRALIAGAHPVAIARLERCSANTIRRIRDGETYNYVVVEGEERIRKPIGIKGYTPREAPTGELLYPVPEIPEEEVEAMAQRLRDGQATAKTAEVDALLPEGMKGIFGPGTGT